MGGTAGSAPVAMGAVTDAGAGPGAEEKIPVAGTVGAAGATNLNTGSASVGAFWTEVDGAGAVVVAAGTTETAETGPDGSEVENEIPVGGAVGTAGTTNLNTGSATAGAF